MILFKNLIARRPESIFGGPGCNVTSAGHHGFESGFHESTEINGSGLNYEDSSYAMLPSCQGLNQYVLAVWYRELHTGNLKASLTVCVTVGPGSKDGTNKVL